MSRSPAASGPARIFGIPTTAQAASSPRTGDNSNIGLWLVFMAVSGGAVAVALPKLKEGQGLIGKYGRQNKPIEFRLPVSLRSLNY